MEIETVDELADWVGVYGTCDNPDCGEKQMNCCRMGFVSNLECRIRDAVENEKKFEEMNNL